MSDSRSTQLKKAEAQLKKYQEKVARLKAMPEDPTKNTHYKIVLGYSAIKGGLRIDPKDKVGQQAFAEYVSRWLPQINKAIDEARARASEPQIHTEAPASIPDQSIF